MSLYCHTVAVCMITYNHSEFIAQAIDSIIMQNTNFSYHLYIGEDCSTDNTREICLEYKKKYPNKITLLLPDKNLGIQTNLIDTLESCKGKYIAFCEGDDYWTDPYKLQKQVDFLEVNAEYGLVHTRYKAYRESLSRFENIDVNIHTGNILKELIQANEIGTLTVLARGSLIKSFVRFIENTSIPLFDYTMWLYIAENSKIGYIPDITAVYRILTESASNTWNQDKKNNFKRSILDIQVFYATRNNCLSLIKEQLINFEKERLKYSFYTRKKDISKLSYNYLLTNQNLGIKDKLFYYGLRYKCLHFLIRVIMHFFN